MIHKNWAELIKPQQLDVKPGNDPARQATVMAEPLERGFGLTLGNALRRVLMSSLQGAAITSVQIDNVQSADVIWEAIQVFLPKSLSPESIPIHIFIIIAKRCVPVRSTFKVQLHQFLHICTHNLVCIYKDDLL